MDLRLLIVGAVLADLIDLAMDATWFGTFG